MKKAKLQLKNSIFSPQTCSGGKTPGSVILRRGKIMQNKANLPNVQMDLRTMITKSYLTFKSLMRVKNKPNLSPREQSQSFNSAQDNFDMSRKSKA